MWLPSARRRRHPNAGHFSQFIRHVHRLAQCDPSATPGATWKRLKIARCSRRRTNDPRRALQLIHDLPAMAEGTAEYYRRRFESSVLGNHAMLPPNAELAYQMLASERPSEVPSGPDTSFQNKTPMPFRFQDAALPKHNQRHENEAMANPIFATTSSEIGRLGLSHTDMPMRWYGLRGEFTNKFYLGGADPKAKVHTGLNTAMDRSGIHHTYDQGWSGHLGLKDHNLGSLSYARSLQRRGR